MPTISLTLPISGTVITAGLHSANYTALQSLLNAGLDTSNWAAGQIFAPSKLTQEAATDKQFLQWNTGSAVWSPAGNWAAYTPTWTSSGVAPVLNNGTLTGEYVQVGKTVIGWAYLTMGSTTTFGTGGYAFSLPVTSVDPGSILGGTLISDVSAVQNYVYSTVLTTTTQVQAFSSAQPAAGLTNAAPVTLAVGDTVMLRFTYQAA